MIHINLTKYVLCILFIAQDFELHIDDDTKQVIGVEITLKNNQPRPEVDDLVLILEKEKGRIESVRGFKHPVVMISFQHPKTSLDLPKKFTVTHVPMMWPYNRMKVKNFHDDSFTHYLSLSGCCKRHQ